MTAGQPSSRGCSWFSLYVRSPRARCLSSGHEVLNSNHGSSMHLRAQQHLACAASSAGNSPHALGVGSSGLLVSGTDREGRHSCHRPCVWVSGASAWVPEAAPLRSLCRAGWLGPPSPPWAEFLYGVPLLPVPLPLAPRCPSPQPISIIKMYDQPQKWREYGESFSPSEWGCQWEGVFAPFQGSNKCFKDPIT